MLLLQREHARLATKDRQLVGGVVDLRLWKSRAGSGESGRGMLRVRTHRTVFEFREDGLWINYIILNRGKKSKGPTDASLARCDWAAVRSNRSTASARSTNALDAIFDVGESVTIVPAMTYRRNRSAFSHSWWKKGIETHCS